MSESIGKRVARLISGNINALIDAAENKNPEIIMKESIKEIDSAIKDIKDELGKSIVEKKFLDDKLRQAKTKHSDLLEQSKIAIKEGRDDLAEVAISKQMDIESQRIVLEENLKDFNLTIKRQEEYIVALQSKKREMEEDIQKREKYKKESNQNSKSIQKINIAENAFNRVMQNFEEDKLTLEDSAKLNELEELQRKNKIQDRLAALKTTIND